MLENQKALEILTKPVLGTAAFKKSICSENQIEKEIRKTWFNSFR